MTKFIAYIKPFVRPKKTVRKRDFDTLPDSDRVCYETKFRGTIDRRYVQLLPPEPNRKIREIEKKLKKYKIRYEMFAQFDDNNEPMIVIKSL